MAYDLTKLVKVSALQQLAEKIKELYYDKEEVDDKLEEFIKNIKLNDALLEKIDQEISITIEPSQTPGALLINGEEIFIPGFISREEVSQISTGDMKWGIF